MPRISFPEVLRSRLIDGLLSSEPFVDANTAAEFLVITRRRVLEMARAGEIPAHPIGGGKRKIWRFRLSELAEAIATKKKLTLPSQNGIISAPAVPGNRIGGTR
jgi:excisionase family DNA binding protein